MKVNVKIAGASYNGVPSVLIPLQAGGTATFCEVSDTTATAEDVATGKTFYTAAGELATGTKQESSGGEAWELQITQTSNQTITATPQFTAVEENGKYCGKFTPDVTISPATGYIPGSIEKTTDNDNKIVTVTAYAAENIDDMVTNGWTKIYQEDASFYTDEKYSSQTWTLSGNTVIAAMKDADVASPVYVTLTNLTQFINTLITSVGDGYLNGAKNLTSANLGNLKSAGSNVLTECTSLTSVDLGNLTTAGGNLLTHCTALKSIKLENLTTADQGLLAACTSLESADLRNLTKAGDNLLKGCPALQSVDLGNLTTAGDAMLNYCTSLTSVKLRNLTTAESGPLNGCFSLTSVDLGNLARVGDKLLYGCTKLQSCIIHSTTPPTFAPGDYSEAINDTCILYVPAGCVDTYKSCTELNALFGGRIQEISE